MLRLLCTGDLHLGRHPTRLPTQTRETSVERVWESIVDYAADQAVDALILSGDIVDRENRFYESVGPLQRGLQRLADAGIEIFAVSGNHDWDVLPDLVDTLDSERFHLLGAGGTWTSSTVKRDGEHAAHLVGWSYRTQHQERSPVDRDAIREALPNGDDIPVLGLLHCDLDQPDSSYAPVSSSELAETPVDAWLLGHVHAPNPYDLAGRLGLYPGSPQPLDPTETGPHGPWIVEVGDDGSIDASMVPLATVRYDHSDVDVSEVEDESDFKRIITSAITSELEEIERGRGPLQHAVYRVRCVGRTARSRTLEEYTARAVDELRPEHGDITATLDAIEVDTRPAIELDRLVDGQDPPAELARLLVALRDDEPVDGALLEDAADRMGDVYEAKAYAPLRRAPETRERPGDAEIREMMYRQGVRLLEALLDQGEAAESGETDG